MCFAPQRRALFQHRNFQKWSEVAVFCTFWLQNVLRATTVCTFSTSQLPKVVRHWCVLYILTSKCASRHKGVHFFDIATSKSGPTMVCFAHFDFKMCFAQNVQNTPMSDHFWKLRCRKSAHRCGAKHILKSKCAKHTMVGPLLEVAMSKKCTPLWREAHFEDHNGVQHLNFQKWSEVAVFCTFCLPNVLRATTACTFSKLDLWASNSAPNPLCF